MERQTSTSNQHKQVLEADILKIIHRYQKKGDKNLEKNKQLIVKLDNDIENLKQRYQNEQNSSKKQFLCVRIPKEIEQYELEVKKIQWENWEIKQFLKILQSKIEFVHERVEDKRLLLKKAFDEARKKTYHQFTADKSSIGDQCAICMEDVEVGRKMVRLGCKGQHTFCQICIEEWFTKQKTCPICRHKF